MYTELSHQTATCPACKKDSWASQYESLFVVVRCMWCGSRFKKGKVVKDKEN